MKHEGAQEDGAIATDTRPRHDGARTKAALLLAAVFLLGGMSGVVVGRVTAMREVRRAMGGPPGERARFRFEAMRRHLDLRDDQAERVKAILDEADGEREALLGSCGPGLEGLRARTHEKIRALLDEEQKRRLDDFEAHRGHGRGPRGGRGPR